MFSETLSAFNFDPQPASYNKAVLTSRNEEGYSGEYNDKGQKDGQGMEWRPDGTIYEGYWGQNKPEGRGRIILAGGDIYEGEWS